MFWERTISQRTYPKVGDIDDCWVIAAIWCARYRTHQTAGLPSAQDFRIAAGNPDNPYKSDGGNVDQANKAVDHYWPMLRSQVLKTQSWSEFVQRLKAGEVASVATLSRNLPFRARFGFNGPHQIAVRWHNRFEVMNPLAPNGSALIPVTEAELRHAVMTVAGGWVIALMFGKVNLGTFKADRSTMPRRYYRYRPTATGWKREVRFTRGFSAVALPPKRLAVMGAVRNLSLVCEGGNAGWYINADRRTFDFIP